MGNWGFLTPNKCSYGFPLLRTGSGAHDVLTPCGAGPDFRQETPWVDPRLDNCEPWRDQTDMTQSASWLNQSSWTYVYLHIIIYIYIHHHIWLRYTVYIHNSYNIYISMPSSSTTSSTIITSSSKTGEKSSSMLIPTKRKYINLRNHHNRRTKVPRCFWLQLPSAPRSNAPDFFFAEKKISPQKNWATCFQSENDLAWKKWGLFDVNLSWVDQVETSWVAWF